MALYMAIENGNGRIQELTEQEARNWAEDIARKHPGVEIFIMKAIAKVQTDSPIPITVTIL